MRDLSKVTIGHHFLGFLGACDFCTYLIEEGIPAFVVMDDYEGERHCIACCDTYSQCLDAMGVWEAATDGECHLFTAYYDEETSQYRRD